MTRVLFYAGVRERVGTFETRVEEFSGTLAGLIEHLEGLHGVSLADLSQTKDTDLLSVLIIMINGRHVAHIGGLDASISDGDTVSIFPLIGGG